MWILQQNVENKHIHKICSLYFLQDMNAVFFLSAHNTHKGIPWYREGWMNRTMAEWHSWWKIKINKLLFCPTFLALRFIHVFLHCGRLQSLCLFLVWSWIKPLASSEHSVRVCVCMWEAVCVRVFFFPSLQMMEAQGSPCFNIALSLFTLTIWACLESYLCFYL